MFILESELAIKIVLMYAHNCAHICGVSVLPRIIKEMESNRLFNTLEYN